MNEFQLSNKIVVYSAWPVAFAGIIALGYAALRVVSALLDDGSSVSNHPANSFNAQPNNPNYDISALGQITPFMISSEQPIVTNEVAPDAPETSLDIVVYGVISSENGTGSVILSVFGQHQVLYKIGDVIDGTQGAVIHSITSDGAVIERQGQFERISFNRDYDERIITIEPESYIPEPSPNYVITTQLPSSENAVPNTPPQPTKSTRPRNNSSETTASLTSASLSRLEIFELASSVRLDSSTRTNGRGLAVYPTRNIRLFDQSGLQAGDVILQIDGIAISQDSDILSLISQFENKTSVTLLIARGNARVQHTVTLSD